MVPCFPVLRFPPLHFGPSFSTPFKTVPRFPVPRFPLLHFWWSRVFSRPIVSFKTCYLLLDITSENVERCLPSCGVCLSVCPSATFVNSVKTNKRIFKTISSQGSHAILLLLYQTLWQYSDGTLTRASNAGGVVTNCNCRLTSDHRSMIDEVGTNATVYRAVLPTNADALMNLCLSQSAWTTTTMRREKNIIYLYKAVNL